MKKNILYFLITIFFVSCGSNNKAVDIPPPPTPEGDKKVLFISDDKETKVKIHNFKGPYPPSIKDKHIGEGVLYFYFKQVENKIESKNLNDSIIKIGFRIRGNDRKLNKALESIKKFFSSQDKFEVVDFNKRHNSFESRVDVVVELIYDNDLKFKIVFLNPKKFPEKGIVTIDTYKTFKEIEKESFSDWSTIKIKTNTGNVVTYQIMKNPVMMSDFYPKKVILQDKPVTGVSFYDADDYCFKKYGGSIARLYIFEYALREGKIKPPVGVPKEMVAGFDEGNDADVVLKWPTDVVQSQEAKDASDYSEIVIFNYQTKEYEFKRDTYKSPDVTFRCIKSK